MVEKFDVTIPPDPTESRPRGHEFGPGSVVAPTRAWQKWAFCFWSSLGIYLKADDTAKSGAMREDASSVPMVCSAASAVVTHDRLGATQRRRFPRGKKHRYQKVSLSQEPLRYVNCDTTDREREVDIQYPLFSVGQCMALEMDTNCTLPLVSQLCPKSKSCMLGPTRLCDYTRFFVTNDLHEHVDGDCDAADDGCGLAACRLLTIMSAAYTVGPVNCGQELSRAWSSITSIKTTGRAASSEAAEQRIVASVWQASRRGRALSHALDAAGRTCSLCDGGPFHREHCSGDS